MTMRSPLTKSAHRLPRLRWLGRECGWEACFEQSKLDVTANAISPKFSPRMAAAACRTKSVWNRPRKVFGVRPTAGYSWLVSQSDADLDLSPTHDPTANHKRHLHTSLQLFDLQSVALRSRAAAITSQLPRQIPSRWQIPRFSTPHCA